jgi:hypothetical protein
MSVNLGFALCIDCWEMGYAPLDSNGKMDPNAGSWQHLDHAVHLFGRPADYPPPIRAVLAHLHASLPVSDARLEMFSLACAVTAIQPNNGRIAATAPSQAHEPPRRADVPEPLSLFEVTA